ncbi:MAG: D-glycero-beta-D-manno-heptose 1-phosphate adenylyltransferase [Acidobacteriota bacterium]|nr:D-glycero-beta-D-manno-heptose 1-phosphate adenylyltransferase [Acidobacteriota bacterium]
MTATETAALVARLRAGASSRDSGLGVGDSGGIRDSRDSGLEPRIPNPKSQTPVIVMTNGVYDLLHPGHVRYLQAARAEGDFLIVGVNTDRSVRAIKGPERPILPEQERAELIAALACVDAVVLFDEETPAAVIEAIQPDVLVKGADWAPDRIVGRDTVTRRGGRVVRIPVEEGHSTTALIERMRGLGTRRSGLGS